MNNIEKTLLLLSGLSIKSGYAEKSLKYSRVGVSLFKDSIPLADIYALGLLNLNLLDELNQFLQTTEVKSRNLCYITARFYMLTNPSEATEHLRSYLTYE